MKTKTLTNKQLNELESNIKGPMMVYNPMTKTQEKELGEWVAKHKAETKAKRTKIKA